MALPTSFIRPGEISHLAIRSGEEGIAPPQGVECTECDHYLHYAEMSLILIR
jgi:hypothetical protein